MAANISVGVIYQPTVINWTLNLNGCDLILTAKMKIIRTFSMVCYLFIWRYFSNVEIKHYSHDGTTLYPN